MKSLPLTTRDRRPSRLRVQDVIGAIRNEGELGSVTVKNTGNKVRFRAACDALAWAPWLNPVFVALGLRGIPIAGQARRAHVRR